MVRSTYLPVKKFNNIALELWKRENKATVLRVRRLKCRVRVFYTQPKDANT
jgi:hypothetical protein